MFTLKFNCMNFLEDLGFIETDDPPRTTTLVQKYVFFKTTCVRTQFKMKDLTRVINARIAYECFMEYSNTDEIYVKEYFYVMALNRNLRLLGIMKVSEGGINGTVADIRLIVKFLIDSLACVTFLCHNHPSGNLMPSDSDKLLTRKIETVLRVCEIELFDHLIITNDDFYSMRENGNL